MTLSDEGQKWKVMKTKNKLEDKKRKELRKTYRGKREEKDKD